MLTSWFAFMVLHGFVEFTWPISLPKISVSVSLQGWSTRSQGVGATDPSGESMTDPSVTCLGMSWDGQPFPRKDPLVRCCFWCFFFLVHSESWDDPTLMFSVFVDVFKQPKWFDNINNIPIIFQHPICRFGTFFIFAYIGNVIIPTDFHIFQRGRSTTNQIATLQDYPSFSVAYKEHIYKHLQK